jgi:Domain of Unknown Function (DUF1206)
MFAGELTGPGGTASHTETSNLPLTRLEWRVRAHPPDMDATSLTGVAEQGRQAKHSTLLEWTIRLGLVSYGVVHLLIAWLALQLAWGSPEGKASGSGALREMASQPFGEVLMWTVGIGFFALVIWQGIEAAIGHTDEEGGKRIYKRAVSAGKALIYGFLGVTAIRFAIGAGGGGGSSEESMTAQLMKMSGGAFLVGLIGLVIVGVGIGLIVKAFTGSFLKKLKPRGRSGELGRAVKWLGRAGYASKGVAYGIVGGLFAWAAVTFDPKKSGGLDDALATLLEQPFGPVLVTLVALGIACYGAFCFVWARHLDQ